jgi:threonine aldolase
MPSSEPSRYTFASDNCAGICPEAWEAMEKANRGFAPGYGDDEWTQKASDLIREVFETDCDVFFTFNGTAANSLSLASMCRSYHSVLCHEAAHIETDECGAPEFFTNGTKILLLPGENGRVFPPAIERMVRRRSDIHYPKPRVVSVTQPTELGTIYSPEELQAIAALCRDFDLRLHMDGARFANAVAALGVTPKEITWQAGVDVLCLGGAKNGLAVGEAVVFFHKDLAREFDFRCKQAGQLASKMRYLAAPWAGILENGAWLRHAAHANAMAAELARRISEIPKIEPAYPVQANAVFLHLPPETAADLRARGWGFYDFIGRGGESGPGLCRFMCSWDTSPEDVADLADDMAECVASCRG